MKKIIGSFQKFDFIFSSYISSLENGFGFCNEKVLYKSNFKVETY